MGEDAMKNGIFKITLVFCATVGMGVLLGCSSEYPASIPLSQNYDTPDPHALDVAGVSVSLSDSAQNRKPKSLITLGEGQDLADLVNKAPGVVLVDFYATWCGPCVKQGKVLHDLENYASQKKASIIKVDVDQHEELATIFDVSALPTLMVIKDGKVVDQQLGLASKTRITELLNR